MFSGLSAAPPRARIGVAFGFLLTAIPFALDVSIVVKMVASPPTSGGTWAVLVLALLFIAAFALAGFRATQLVAAGNPLGCVIFSRPAYVLLFISLLDMIRAFTSYGGGVLTFLAGLGLAALCFTVIVFYRWLAPTMPAGGWTSDGTGDRTAMTRSGPAAPKQPELVEVVKQIPPIAADVVTGKVTADEATRRIVSIAGGSEAMLAEASRIYAGQAAKADQEHVRAVAAESVRLTERARQQVLATPVAPARDR